MDNQDEQLNQPNELVGNSLQPTPDSVPKHVHNGNDAPRLNPKYFMGFPTIQVTDATATPTLTVVNGTILFLYDGTNYVQWVRINNIWEKFTAGIVITPGQIVGTSTNDDASAGNVGQYLQNAITSGGAISMTSAVTINVTSFSLTAGDWDVEGIVNFSPSGASASDFKAGISSTSATFGGDNTWNNLPLVATGLSAVVSENILTVRYSLASTTTIYLVAQSTFSLGSISVYGLLRARRVR